MRELSVHPYARGAFVDEGNRSVISFVFDADDFLELA